MTPNQARFTRIVAAVEAMAPPHPDDAAWFAKRYRHAIKTGTGLEEAFGLVQRGGAGGLHRVEALRRRDTILRDLAAEHFPGLQPNTAARAILAIAERRRRQMGAPTGPAEAMVDAALLTGQRMPRVRRLAEIIAQ